MRSEGKGGHWFPWDCLSSPLALGFGGGRGSFPGFGNVVAFVFQLLFLLVRTHQQAYSVAFIQQFYCVVFSVPGLS